MAVNEKGTLLAAGDDSGEVAVIDLAQGDLRKRLSGEHSNICSCVSFRRCHPWEGDSAFDSQPLTLSL